MSTSIQSQIVDFMAEIEKQAIPISAASLLTVIFKTYATVAYSDEMLSTFFTIHKPTAKGSGYMDMSHLAISPDLDLSSVGTSYWLFSDGSLFYLNAYSEGAEDK